MSLRIDKVKLQFIIDQQRKGDALEKINDDLRTQQKLVNDLEKQKKQAEKKNRKNPEAEEVRKITAEYEKEKAKLEQLEREKNDYINTTKLETMNLRQLQDELKRYNMILANLTPGSEAFGKTQEYVNQLKNRIKELRTGVDSTKKSLTDYAAVFNHFGFAFINVTEIIGKLKDWTMQAAQAWLDYNKQLAESARLTREFLGLTGGELEAVRADILATAAIRSTTSALNAIGNFHTPLTKRNISSPTRLWKACRRLILR